MDTLELLRRTAARKSDLDRDKETMTQAANEIERLRAALLPFTRITFGIDEPDVADTDEWFRHDGNVLRVSDFRRARAASSHP